MTYVELTKRDIYCYHRGQLSEYIRNHPEIKPAEKQQLLKWISNGHDIHSNPFGMYDYGRHREYDYLDALRMIKAS